MSAPRASPESYFSGVVHAADSASPFRYRRHEPEKTLRRWRRQIVLRRDVKKGYVAVGS